MPRKALIVEDDVPVARTLAQILKYLDIEAAVLNEGKDAVAWVREHTPDVVLLDLMLPDISGYEICQQLKLDRATNLTPVVIVSARSLHEDLVQGLRVGANHYLTKPFSIEDLEHAIKAVLDWRENLKQTGTEGEVHFQFGSDTQYLHELNKMLASLFLFSGLDEEQVTHLTTAVWEMGTNAIEWGNRKRAEMPVTVTYRIDKEKVVIVIRDSGPGFDRSRLPHAATPSDPAAHMEVRESMGLRVGGFGIVMAGGLVDELQYNDRGNEVRLVKRFKPRSEPRKDAS